MTVANLLSRDRNYLFEYILQDWDKTVTFFYVLVQLVNKRVQMLPLLGRELKCIAAMNPLTQGAETKNRRAQKEKSTWAKQTRIKLFLFDSWRIQKQVCTLCQCLVRWFPPKQTESGNPQEQTTARQSYRHWSTQEEFTFKPYLHLKHERLFNNTGILISLLISEPLMGAWLWETNKHFSQLSKF